MKKDYKSDSKKKFSKKEDKKSFSNKNEKINSKLNQRYKNYIVKEQKDYSNLDKIIWIYSQSKNNDFWFVDVEWIEKWYFVYPKNLNWALDGDEVEAVLQTFNRRKEAIITKVLKRADRILVWKIEIVKDYAFVVLDNIAFKKDVYIPSKKLSKFKNIVKNSDKVAIKITNWEWKNPEWSIIEVLWDENKKWNDILSIALEMWARIRFPEYVLEEAKKLKYEQQKNRIDLTNNLIYTIDWDDAKDLDDAVLVEKQWENFKLLVSIADVAQYVLEDSYLDKEALKRWNSIYLVDRVIPMLPEKLSNDLCSLNPNTNKLTLTCEMIIDNNWDVISKKVYESIISSKFRLTYREVQEILDKKLLIWNELKFGWIITEELTKSLENALELKNIISNKKKISWILDFDFPETKIKLDEKGFPISIEKYERYQSMKIIEEFMILANSSVWELYLKYPFVYRIHPLPNDDDIEKLRNTLNIFGIKLPYKTITPKVLSEILNQIVGNPKEKLIQKMILRSLEKAIYSIDNEWHFGLNLEFYSHFTSPIRRYPDLQIHRIIKDKLSSEKIEHFKNILPKVCKHTSDTERKAEKMEYAVRDLMICKYYENHIWEEYDWVISWMIESWFFVELDNTAEWFVSIEQVSQIISRKKYNYDIEHMKFEFTKDLAFQIGDKVKVKISSIEIEKRRLNFDLIKTFDL